MVHSLVLCRMWESSILRQSCPLLRCSPLPPKGETCIGNFISAEKMEQVQRAYPRELDSGARLDRAIERFIIYTPIGTAAGLALSFMFQRRFLRATVIGFGTGAGFGLAWGDTKQDYAHPTALHGRRLWRASPGSVSSHDSSH